MSAPPQVTLVGWRISSPCGSSMMGGDLAARGDRDDAVRRDQCHPQVAFDVESAAVGQPNLSHASGPVGCRVDAASETASRARDRTARRGRACRPSECGSASRCSRSSGRRRCATRRRRAPGRWRTGCPPPSARRDRRDEREREAVGAPVQRLLPGVREGRVRAPDRPVAIDNRVVGRRQRAPPTALQRTSTSPVSTSSRCTGPSSKLAIMIRPWASKLIPFGAPPALPTRRRQPSGQPLRRRSAGRMPRCVRRGRPRHLPGQEPDTQLAGSAESGIGDRGTGDLPRAAE